MKIDIHNCSKQAKLALVSLKKSSISKKNIEVIERFVDSCIADGMSAGRVAKHIHTIKSWAIWLDKDFDMVTKEDIAQVITKLQLNEKYTAWTKKDFKVLFKRFFKWFKQTEDYPLEVKWINTRMKMCDRRLPGQGELLTENDIKNLLEVINSPRDKALVAMLWESGCRVGELCSLQLSNVEIDKYGILITVSGKTGSRKLRLISSTAYLMDWLKMHPTRNDKSSPLWVNIGSVNTNMPIKYRNVSLRIKEYFRQAKINKRCYPHLFRHSRATYLANHLTEFQMNQYFGWIQGSDMPSTYVHMSGRDIDDAILTMNGVKTEELKKESQMLPRICPRCDTINAYDSKYCSKCAGILDLKFAMELEQRQQEEMKMRNSTDELMNRLLRDKDVQKLLMEKLQMMA